MSQALSSSTPLYQISLEGESVPGQTEPDPARSLRAMLALTKNSSIIIIYPLFLESSRKPKI
jgi:hypothetical protein